MADISLEYWAATSGIRQLKLYVEGPSEELSTSRGLLALNRKQCRLVTRLLTGHCILGCHLCGMGLLDNVVCRICEQEEDCSYHIFCYCRAWIGHRVKIFSSAWLELIDILRASKKFLALTLRSGLFWRALVKMGSCRGPNNGLECLGRLEIAPSVSIQYTVRRLSVVFPPVLPGKCKNSAWIRP